MHPLVRLMRPLTSLMIGVAVFASAFVATGSGIVSFLFPITLAILATFFFGSGGNVINDYLDLESDKINHPERPIPSGQVTKNKALHFAFILFGISGALTIVLGYISGYQVLILVFTAFIIQMAYEFRFKHEKIVGNIVIGAQVALAFIFGGLVVESTKATGLLAGLAFVSIVGREIIKDIEDVEGDVDKNTLPKYIGVTGAGMVASFLLLLAIAGSILPFILGVFGKTYIYLVGLADLIFLAALPLIFRNPHAARRIIKIGMLIVLGAFVVGRITLN